MVCKFATILFLLPVIYARIEIDLSSLNEEERDVRISGKSVHIINDQDMRSFGLTETALRKSVWSYFGSLPDNVYVKGPTLWGDLYKIFNWEPVKRVLAPTKAHVLSVNSEPTLLFTRTYFNNDANDMIFKSKFQISQISSIANTVSARWEKEGNFDENIHHLFDLNSTMDSSYYSVISKFGDDFEKFEPMSIASEVNVTVKPQQTLLGEVFATKNTFMVRVDYETTLLGTVAVNFDKKYNGHRFWALDINTLLNADGLKKTIHSSEIIEFVHFTDVRVSFKDAMTSDVISTLPLELV